MSDAVPPIQGELVTETFDHDGGREVTVYLPPDRPAAVIYGGDGQLISGWGGQLEATGSVPAAIVGVHRTDDPDEMARIREYSPSFDPAVFEAHERFLLTEVREWVGSRFGLALPPDRTAALGVSASGELALALGLRHPDVFGIVLSASPGGGYHPPVPMPTALPRTYLVAGTEEPFFRENAERWARALDEAGGEVVMTVRDGGHGDPLWAAELPLMVEWAFGVGQPAIPTHRMCATRPPSAPSRTTVRPSVRRLEHSPGDQAV